MSKKRVYELAREVGLESKIVIKKLKDIGIAVASHQSALDEKQVLKFQASLNGEQSSSETSAKQPVVRRRKRVTPEPVVESAKEKAEKAFSSEFSTEARQEETFVEKESALVSSKSEVTEEEIQKEEVLSKSEKVESEQGLSSPAEEEEKVSLEQEKKEESISVKESQSIETKVSITSPKLESSEKVSVSKSSESSESLKKAVSSKKPELDTKKPSSEKRFQSGGGATIVRRATKEESAALQQQRETQRYRGSRDEQSTRGGYTPSRGGAPLKRRDPQQRPSGSEGFQRRSPSAGGAPQQASAAPSFERAPSSPSSSERSFSTRSDRKIPGSPQEDSRSPRPALKPKKPRFSFNSQMLDDDYASRSKRRRVFSNSSDGRRRAYTPTKHKKTEITVPRQEYRVVKMERDTISVSELALQLNVKAAELIKKLMAQGVMATVNQEVDFDTATLMAGEYDYECKSVKKTADDLLKEEVVNPEDLETRPPIITVMGHVDHGKTSILDAIRETGVADKEAGGITQHIGAYMVQKGDSKLTFLDTPGHAAFSAMRSRGAQLTDLVILVVAADDGVMPQTIEAIAHAKAAGVPLVVAVNKIDKENVNFDRIYSELSEQGIQAESWGGDTQFVHVSALKKEGLDELLEAVQLQAEVLDLKASPAGFAKGTVVEAHLDKGRGAVATAIVTEGTLSVGDFVVVGSATGRVRAMIDHEGKRLKKAGPSTPVEIIGLGDIPQAADPLNVVVDDKTAKEVSALRVAAYNEANKVGSSAQSLDELLGKVQSSSLPQISVLLKADTQGTVEAISDAISKLKSEKVTAKVVYKGVGGISESDLNLAETCGAVVLGFNVRMPGSLTAVSDKKGIVVNYFSVIYKLVDSIKDLMAGKLPPVTSEVIQGHAEVKEAIRIPKIGLIAGSSVTDGKITRNSHLRLIRNDVVIHTGKLSALKRFKDDVKEVQNGYECGISFENCTDIKTGDVIESYTIEESPAELDI